LRRLNCTTCDSQHSSTLANRASLIEESAKAKLTARDAARLEKQRKLAEVLRTKADAEERGEDVEAAKNWEWTIEENDLWERKKARKARRADFEFHGEVFSLPDTLLGSDGTKDDAHAARRRYKKDLDLIKPDLVAYNQQKEVAMGLAPGALVRPADATAGPSSSPHMQVPSYLSISIKVWKLILTLQVVPTSEQQQLAAEHLYRDANSLLYADNKPSEDAIDRVVSKMNREYVHMFTLLFWHSHHLQHRQEG
jgi:pre-mRNA-splicing factor SYF2